MQIRLEAKEFEVPDAALAGADQLVFTMVQRIVMIPDSGQMRLKKIAAEVQTVDAVIAGKRRRVWAAENGKPIPALLGWPASWSRQESAWSRFVRWLKQL